MKIGVDVDLTVVDTLTPWLEWFEEETGKDSMEVFNNFQDSKDHYGLQDHMERYLGYDPMEYWRDEQLYDDKQPFKEAVTVLKDANEQGNEIYFISQTMPEHYKSKVRFIEKHFPFHSGFIATSEKHLCNFDIFIDDSLSKLRKMLWHNKNTEHLILFETILNKNIDVEFQKMDWQQIDYFIKKLLLRG